VFLLLFAAILSGIYADIEFPLTQSLVHLPYLDNSLLPKGESSLYACFTVSNICVGLRNDKTIVDFEQSSAKFHYRYGISSRLTLGFSFVGTLINGGFMDKFISGFHDIFGLPNGFRNLRADDTVKYRSEKIFEYLNKKAFVNSPHLSVFYNLVKSKRFTINIRGSLGIPLNQIAGFTNNKPSLDIGLIGQYGDDNLRVESSNYIAGFSTPSWLDQSFLKSNLLFYSETRLIYKWIILGAKLRSSPLKLKYFSSMGSSLILGVSLFKGRVELLFHEDLPPLHTTPDIGLEITFRIIQPG
jgi:hypothetical protein